MSDIERLARIENKLDELSQAIVALARVEERMSMIYAAHERHAERLVHIEAKLQKNGVTLGLAERMFWIVVTAGVGMGAAYYGVT